MMANKMNNEKINKHSTLIIEAVGQEVQAKGSNQMIKTMMMFHYIGNYVGDISPDNLELALPNQAV